LALIALFNITPKFALLDHMLVECTQLNNLQTQLTGAQHHTLLPKMHVEFIGVLEVVVHFSTKLALHVVFLFDRCVSFRLRQFCRIHVWCRLRGVFRRVGRFNVGLLGFLDLNGLLLGVLEFSCVNRHFIKTLLNDFHLRWLNRC